MNSPFKREIRWAWRWDVLILSLLILSQSCAVRYVADYDARVTEEIIKISRKVDLFYSELLETSPQKREYKKFKNIYLEIESDLRSLLMRNQIRPLNEESTEQVKIALELWIDDKARHKTKDTVTDFAAKKHREQFQRIFIAMAKGEEAKKTSSQPNKNKMGDKR